MGARLVSLRFIVVPPGPPFPPATRGGSVYTRRGLRPFRSHGLTERDEKRANAGTWLLISYYRATTEVVAGPGLGSHRGERELARWP